MRRLTLSALAVALVDLSVPAARGQDDAQEKAKKEAVARELKALEGAWELVATVVGGERVTPAAAERGRVLYRPDGSFTAEVSGKVVRAGRLEVDPSKTPKAVDITITAGPLKGKTTPAIYALEGDELRMALPGPGRPRPTAFTAEGDRYLVIQVYRRVKPKP